MHFLIIITRKTPFAANIMNTWCKKKKKERKKQSNIQPMRDCATQFELQRGINVRYDNWQSLKIETGFGHKLGGKVNKRIIIRCKILGQVQFTVSLICSKNYHLESLSSQDIEITFVFKCMYWVNRNAVIIIGGENSSAIVHLRTWNYVL